MGQIYRGGLVCERRGLDEPGVCNVGVLGLSRPFLCVLSDSLYYEAQHASEKPAGRVLCPWPQRHGVRRVSLQAYSIPRCL